MTRLRPESFSATNGVLTLTFDPSTDTLTGYFNGTPVASISLVGWGPNPSLTLAVVGLSGEGINVPAGTDTASNFFLNIPLQVTTTALPNGANGVAYSQQLSAIYGQLPYSWSLISGSLPSGLTLATNGVISGTPTTNGTFNFTVKVTDALSATATQPLTLTVGSPPSVVDSTDEYFGCGHGRKQCEFRGVGGGHRPLQLPMATERNQPPQRDYHHGGGRRNTTVFGDGDAATNAELYYPSGVAVDATGNLFIADSSNQRIRKVGTNGIITTVAGNGTYGYSGDGGAATNAELSNPVWRGGGRHRQPVHCGFGKQRHPQGGHQRDYHHGGGQRDKRLLRRRGRGDQC